VDSAQYARSVREDTAELASYALSEGASAPTGSPPTHQRSAQAQLESYFTQASESDSASNRESERLSSDIIQEVSEPVSPEGEASSKSWKPSGTSALADMFRGTSLGSSPPGAERRSYGDSDDGNSHSRDGADVDVEPGPLVINPSRPRVHATERTSLISKVPTFESHSPSWMPRQQDPEDQQDLRMTSPWSNMRKIVLWPREKVFVVARTVTNPKRWDRKAIWRNAVLAPISCLPAVILGLLLNILDALSYGRPSSWLSCLFPAPI
jgi:sulfate permease, SulP family